MPAPPQPEQPVDLAKLYVWIKGVESKVNTLVREVEVVKNDLMKKQQEIKKDSKTLGEELLDLRREQEKSLQKMDLVIKELKKTAGAEEVITLKKYLDLWNPLHFVTQRDVERLVEQKLQQKLSEEEKLQSLAEEEVERERHKNEKNLPYEKHLPFM
ncbi:hypothetical protein HYX13_04255 [Candidatus Woesearchaeota archaeon]|nr:hypothetical protein [Candidatus Woesearchaeota archaeon]